MYRYFYYLKFRGPSFWKAINAHRNPAYMVLFPENKHFVNKPWRPVGNETGYDLSGVKFSDKGGFSSS
jgi:hypothetical protein